MHGCSTDIGLVLVVVVDFFVGVAPDVPSSSAVHFDFSL